MRDILDDKTKLKLAKEFKKVRGEKRLTQAQVAKLAGLNTNFYANVERKVKIPTSSTLLKIAKALGIKSSNILPF